MTLRLWQGAVHRLGWPQAAALQTYAQPFGCRFEQLHHSRGLSRQASEQPALQAPPPLHDADVVNVPSSPLATTAAAAADANVGAAAVSQQAAVVSSKSTGKADAPAADASQQSYISSALLAEISGAINRLTGYESIEYLKSTVVNADNQLQESKKWLQAAKEEYDSQLSRQTQLHREVTALLQRKSSWVPADVARFTELYAAEHQTEQAVAAAKASYSNFSRDVEQLQLQLMNMIRERYQQEQLWSDKIRRASTWWTWGLMGLHFASFIAVYTVLEPRKRRALQDAMTGMLQNHQVAIDNRLLQLQLTPAAATTDEAAESADEQTVGQIEALTPAVWQEQQQDAVNQQVLHGLQKLQQQLQQMQQLLPQQGAAAATEVQQQQQRQRQWLPGMSWAMKQVAAAREHGKVAWRHTRRAFQGSSGDESAQEVAGTSCTSNDATGGMPKHPEHSLTQQIQRQKQPLTQVDNSANVSLQRHTAEQQNPKAAAPELQAGHRTRTSDRGEAPAGAFNTLIQQIRNGDSVLQVTRNQLAAVGVLGAGAGAAAGVLLVVLLSAFGGKGAGA